MSRSEKGTVSTPAVDSGIRSLLRHLSLRSKPAVMWTDVKSPSEYRPGMELTFGIDVNEPYRTIRARWTASKPSGSPVFALAMLRHIDDIIPPPATHWFFFYYSNPYGSAPLFEMFPAEQSELNTYVGPCFETPLLYSDWTMEYTKNVRGGPAERRETVAGLGSQLTRWAALPLGRFLFRSPYSLWQPGGTYHLEGLTSSQTEVSWVTSRPHGDPLFCANTGGQLDGDEWGCFYYSGGLPGAPRLDFFPLPEEQMRNYVGPVLDMRSDGAFEPIYFLPERSDDLASLKNHLNRLAKLPSDRTCFSVETAQEMAPGQSFILRDLAVPDIHVDWVSGTPSGDPLFCIRLDGSSQIYNHFLGWGCFYYKGGFPTTPRLEMFFIGDSTNDAKTQISEFFGPFFQYIPRRGTSVATLESRPPQHSTTEPGLAKQLQAWAKLPAGREVFGAVALAGAKLIRPGKPFMLQGLTSQQPSIVPTVTWAGELDQIPQKAPLFSLFLSLSGFNGCGRWAIIYYVSPEAFIAVESMTPAPKVPTFLHWGGTDVYTASWGDSFDTAD